MILRDPHCMAYVGGISFANMGGGGGQNLGSFPNQAMG